MHCVDFICRAISKNENVHLSVVLKPNPIIDEFYCDNTSCTDVSDVYNSNASYSLWLYTGTVAFGRSFHWHCTQPQLSDQYRSPNSQCPISLGHDNPIEVINHLAV